MRVIEILGHVPEASQRISTAALRQALEGAGIEYLVTLPESPYEVLLRDLLHDSSLPNVEHLDFLLIARGAGISQLHRYGDLATFKRELPQVMNERGPVFTVLDIEPDETHLAAHSFSKKVRSRDKDFNKQFREALREA